jgi:hypothetical protein
MKSTINKSAILRIVITIAGYALLTFGISQIYAPAGYIAAGILLSVEAWK